MCRLLLPCACRSHLPIAFPLRCCEIRQLAFGCDLFSNLNLSDQNSGADGVLVLIVRKDALAEEGDAVVRKEGWRLVTVLDLRETSTTMANAIGRGVRQQVLPRSALNRSGEDRIPGGVLSNVNRRFVSSQANGLDGRKDLREIAPSLAKAVLPWSWSYQGARSFHTRNISQLVAPKGNKRLFLVDTLALVKRLESQGLTSKQAEAITAAITEVLNDSLENVGQTFTSIHEAQRSEMMAEAALSKFKGQMQSSQEHHFSMLQQETERLRTDIDKMRNESKYAIDKVTSGQRLDLNLERGRIRDELATQATETSNLTNKLDREIHSLKTQLEAAKFDVIKYCIGTIVSLTAVGLGMLRLIM